MMWFIPLAAEVCKIAIAAIILYFVVEMITPMPGWARQVVQLLIILLAILALLAIVGTLVPQLPQNPQGVMGYVLRHPVTAPWFARLGLFDIFSSWPFIIVAVLMYTSIGASMFIRVPAAWRRAMDPAQRNRGLFAEVASIIFHGSFFILLVGVLFGKAAGFLGNVAIVEGDSFTEARANYDNLSEGILATQHADFQVKVDKFSASYWPSGAPRDFTSRVRIYDGGRLIESKSIQVNHYVDYRGVKIYQAGFGWAPTLKIETPDGRVVEGDPTRPTEAAELWTFRRAPGSPWLLSAIQQAR